MKILLAISMFLLFVSIALNLWQEKRIEWLEEEKNIMLTLYGEQLIKLPLSDAEEKIVNK